MIQTTSKICCPVCLRKADGCLVTEDGKGAICVRTPSNKRAGAAGWYHKTNTDPLPRGCRKKVKNRPANINWNALQSLYMSRYCGNKFPDLSSGWNGEAVTIPMYNNNYDITGFQQVFHNGDKKFMHGSKPGLFITETILDCGLGNTVVITEGVSDTQTATDMGFCALGRSSCNQGIDILLQMLDHGIDIIIIPDNDAPGLAGGKALAQTLVDHDFKVHMLVPPITGGDLTDWVKQDGELKVGLYINDIQRKS